MKEVNLYLKRKKLTDKSTTGVFEFLDENMILASLEDPVRDKKIKSVTAIPEMVYELGLRKFDEDKPETWSGMTKRYRENFDWFKWHIHIKNVPGFKHVYIHIGNKPEDSDGCVLVATKQTGDNFISQSTVAYKKLYLKLLPLLEDENVVVFLHVENCF